MATKKASTRSARTPSVPPVAMSGKGTEVVKRIPLADIVADFQWNARSVGFENTSGLEPIEHGQDWADFVASIETEGQQDPCDVRPLKNGKFGLVAGFRRFLAVKTVAETRKDKAPTLLCVVRAMTDAQARMRNAVENLGRDDLSVPDAAWAAKLAKDAAKAEGAYKDDKSLAAQLGKSQGVIQKYLQCAEHLKPSVMQAWRQSKSPLTLLECIAVAKLPHDEQEAKFRELEQARIAPAGAGKQATPAKKAADGAVKFGRMLGKLARVGALGEDFPFGEFDWNHWIPLLVEVSGNKQPTTSQWRTAAKFASEAFTKEKGEESSEAAT